MELKAGQRFWFENRNKYWRLTSGTLEVYASTTEKRLYRQVFIARAMDNDCIFPLPAERGIVLQLYATTDCCLEEGLLDEIIDCEAGEIGGSWVKNKLADSWLKRKSEAGDHNVRELINKLFADDNDVTMSVCCYAESLNQILDDFFSAEEEKSVTVLDFSRKNQKSTVQEAMGILLQEEVIHRADDIAGGVVQSEVAVIVRQTAKALKLPECDLRLLPEIAAQLDLLGILRRLTKKANINIRMITLEKGWYKKDSGVIIGYFGEDKELSLFEPVSPGKYRIINRSFPEGAELDDEKAAQLEERAFACYAGLPARKLTPKDILNFIFQHCWPMDMWMVVLTSLVSGLVALFLPTMTETVFADLVPIRDYQGLTTVTQVAVAAAFTTAVVGAVKAVTMLRLMTHISVSVEAAIISRMLSLPAKFFRQFESGDLAKRLVGVNSVQEVLGGDVIPTVFSFLFSFWSLLLMCYYNIKITLLALVIWGIYAVVMFIIYRNIVTYQRNLVAVSNKTAGMLQQIFTGLAKFRLRGAENQAYNIWSKLFAAEWQENLRLRWQKNFGAVVQSVQPILMTLLLFLVVMADLEEKLKAGNTTDLFQGAQFMAFLTAFTGFDASLNEVIPTVSNLFAIKPHLENIMPILEETPEVVEDKQDANLLTGSIDVKHLSFAYTPGGREILHDLSFSVKAGEHVAIVGTSGCGKSTLIRLLLGFESPSTGAIYYDGQDLSNLNLPSVRSQMGVVLQNGQLMSGDIFSNIVGTMAFTQDDAWAAAEAAGIADDIREMPMGMQTVISEGSSNISGGQRQRILIARALVAKPAILVFDEATSALDNRTQAIVTASLNKLKTTRLVVAHRLSTIRNADRIIALDQGKIMEMGTFDELVAKKGLFAELVKRQQV